MKYCRECAAEMSEEAKACPKCGCPVKGSLYDGDNTIPAVVNVFLPGVGQMIQGRVGRGIGILLAFILLSWTIIAPIIIWIWAILDAKNYKGE